MQYGLWSTPIRDGFPVYRLWTELYIASRIAWKIQTVFHRRVLSQGNRNNVRMCN